jgi:predicted esterase
MWFITSPSHRISGHHYLRVHPDLTRRRFNMLLGGSLLSCGLWDGCIAAFSPPGPDDGRITARPREGVSTSAVGERVLGLDADRDAILRVPQNAGKAKVPLLVLLHGAGGSGDGILRRLGSTPDEAGIAVLSPTSRDQTWDAITGRFGADIPFLTRALERVFDSVAVDQERIAVGGFSDGATYALSLGLINGDLFRRVVAFSPGFFVEGTRHGRPRVFVSHGTGDQILPIDQCSRRIVPALQNDGYAVTYREFDGRHEVPSDIAREAMRWIAAGSTTGVSWKTSVKLSAATTRRQ